MANPELNVILMNEEIEFTLIVQGHRSWGSFYHVWPNEGVIRYFSASGQDYPTGTSKELYLQDGG